jgi:virginiamycin B lyase
VNWSRAARTSIIVLGGLSCAAGASLGAVFEEFLVPTPASAPQGITKDWRGDVWFTEFEGNRIGRIDRGTDAITEFPIPTPNSGPASIISVLTASTTFEMWFTEFRGNQIGKISRDGIITEYRLPSASSGPRVIVENVDGGLWFTEFEGNRIGRIDRSGQITEFAIPTPGSGPYGITVATDYSLWFTEFHANKIGRIALNGMITEYSIPTPNSGPLEIVAGPDGAFWFTESRANKIGRIIGSGVTTEFPLPLPDRGPEGISNGPGGLWFTERSANRLGRLRTTGGLLSEFSIPIEGGSPAGIVAGYSDRRMWFAASGSNRIGSITRERLAIAGAGRIGNWETSLEIANSKSYEQGVWTGSFPEAPGACFGSCPGQVLALRANGSERIAITSGIGTLYVDPEDIEPPTVVARVSNRDRPSQTMEIPVLRVSTLESLNPSALAFPSAIRSAEGHSNLILAEVGGTRDIAARIEAFSSEGENLGSLDLSLGAGRSIFLVDVLNQLGVTFLDLGQIRVSKTAGTGLMWGILTTVFEDGGVAVTVGTNP